jgi:hypothetical protein
MFSDSERSTILTETKRLAPRLYEVVAVGLAKSRSRLSNIDHREHPVLLPLLLRADMRLLLEREGLPEGWEVGGDSRLMEELLFINRDLGLEQRFVKERRRTYPGGIRPAGHSKASRRYYTNPTLDLGPNYELPAPTTVSLLTAWDLVDASDIDLGFTLRIVHPLEPGVYGRAVKSDLSIDLLPGGEIFDNREFLGSPDLGNIFDEVEVAAEEENTGEQ